MKSPIATTSKPCVDSIEKLPQDLDKMKSLQILGMDDNEIESLPNSVCALSELTK